MGAFKNSAEDEIRRLRLIIEKLEATKQMRVITVDIVRRENPNGYFFYITAPTVANEEMFGKAMATTIQQAFHKIDVNMERPDIISVDHVAPPKKRVQ
jgi:hypothetical protein